MISGALLHDLTDDEARRALPLKWGAVPEDTVPAWVAEMDFALAPPLVEALTDAVRAGRAGYPAYGDGGVGAAFSGFAARHWGQDLPVDAAVLTGDVIAAIRLALEVLCPAGPVVVPLPCYPPFREVVALAGREMLTVETDPDSDDAALDLAALEDAFRAGGRTLLLCNPHNPLGHVPSRDELVAVRDLAAAYDVRVVADEIHGALTLDGALFTPYLTIDPGAIVVTSASKAFNTAGLHCAALLTLDPAERARLHALPVPQNNGMSPLGVLAARVAWTDGDPWLAELVTRLSENRDLLGKLVAEHLPRARTRPLEATYLAWLDLRDYGVADPAAAGLARGVKVAPGTDYHPGLPGHVRLNTATSPERLGVIVERLAAAVSR